MKRFYLIPALLLPVALLLLAYSSGAPAGYTGSPGDNGNYCSACHSGGPTYQPQITLSGLPAQGYTPGQTYTLTLDVANVNNPRTGFEACVEDATHQKTGSFSSADNNTLAFNNGDYVTHTSQGNSLHQWTFRWQAPSTDRGDLTLYCAVNLTNGNGNTSGDTPVTTSFALPSAATYVEKWDDARLKIYPNPAHDLVHIQTRMEIRQVQAVDMQGRRYVLHLQGKSLDVGQLPAGNYVLFFQTGRGAGTKILVKK